VLEVADEGLEVEVGPVVDLALLVVGLDHFLEGVLGSSIGELVLARSDVGAVVHEADLRLLASIGGLELKVKYGKPTEGRSDSEQEKRGLAGMIRFGLT
jgi:hypothetical protein